MRGSGGGNERAVSLPGPHANLNKAKVGSNARILTNLGYVQILEKLLRN